MVTQEEWIIERLRKNGSITRNECLRNYISRLGARISDLKAKGWVFKTSRIEVETPFGKGYDFEYKLIKLADN